MTLYPNKLIETQAKLAQLLERQKQMIERMTIQLSEIEEVRDLVDGMIEAENEKEEQIAEDLERAALANDLSGPLA